MSPATASFCPSEQIWLMAVNCGPDPEDWENYLILEQIAQGHFQIQPVRFQQAYEDVVLRLQSAGLLANEPVLLILTPDGLEWKQEFAHRFLGC
ncbi:MAG: hypothetical protein ACAI44_15055 [Candidatus Sericytochromatia bacterium]